MGPLTFHSKKKGKLMRVIAKASCAIGILAAVALNTSVADARSVKTARPHASVPAPPAGRSIPYDAGGVPYPTGHGPAYSSPDFQLQG